MATPLCAAAACRLYVCPPASPAAPGRGRLLRGLVAVRAEAGVGGINPAIRKEEPKVVDTVLAAELSKPLTAYCRCWRSGTFPLCDGSHVKHNKETGDNDEARNGALTNTKYYVLPILTLFFPPELSRKNDRWLVAGSGSVSGTVRQSVVDVRPWSNGSMRLWGGGVRLWD
ncbi:hypothetical protein GUJ93_ZPchr0013g35452 [Zizania palustris]|uniref:Iron-binding zinc finger CDGSH type domain-containing protein n=1 Tax=Zizania palustris TaxID=103762 RepID=A0A8J5X2E4_ZIZPA|nr:hypothetical protein GUJ93_ZPchr0013g35452 [Zizania palustris]